MNKEDNRTHLHYPMVNFQGCKWHRSMYCWIK